MPQANAPGAQPRAPDPSTTTRLQDMPLASLQMATRNVRREALPADAATRADDDGKRVGVERSTFFLDQATATATTGVTRCTATTTGYDEKVEGSECTRTGPGVGDASGLEGHVTVSAAVVGGNA